MTTRAMQLQGMSDRTYFRLLDEVTDIRYLIVTKGGMATKSLVEDVLMARHGLDRGDAHSLLNANESANTIDFMIDRRGVHWQAKRKEPDIDDWPEIIELIKEKR